MSDFDDAFQSFGPDMILQLGGEIINYEIDGVGNVDLRANPQNVTAESKEVLDVEAELADTIFEFMTTDLFIASQQREANRGDIVTRLDGRKYTVTTVSTEGPFTKVVCDRFTIPDAV